MNIYDHFQYSEWIARHMKSIAHTDDSCHFLKSDEIEEISDLEERMSVISDRVLIAIDGLDSFFDWHNDENLMNSPQYYTAIIMHAENGNIDSIHAVKEICKTLIMELISHMMQDFESSKNGLEFLDPTSMIIHGIGPVADNFYGVQLGFSVNNPISFNIDQSKWI